MPFADLRDGYSCAIDKQIWWKVFTSMTQRPAWVDLFRNHFQYASSIHGYNRSLAQWILEFRGIPRNKGVNFHGKFRLGISNRNNSGSKNLEIPRNFQKFQLYSQQDLEFLGIPTQRTNDFPWKAVNLKNS